MNLIFLIMKVKIDFWSIASIILNGGIYMNALTDIKSKIEKNKEEKRERLLASATALFAERNFNNTSISDIREFDSCLQFFTNQIAQNVDYINAFEFFYCQIRENKCTNMGQCVL